VHVSVAANTGAQRTGSLVVGNVTVTVRQEAAPAPGCGFDVAPASVSVPASGGPVTLTVSLRQGSGCAWTARSSDDFITIDRGAEGTDAGTIALIVAPNDGEPRSGTVSVAGQVIGISQDGRSTAGCTFAVTPTTAPIPASGGNVTVAVSVTQGSNCAWTAAPQDSFISISGAASGTGDASIVLVVAPNPTGGNRTGLVTIAGQVVTVTQQAAGAPACRFDVSPKSVSLPVSGGTATFTVTMTEGVACPWSITLAGTGMTIVSGASGTGSGTVVVSVAANPGTARTNGVIIAGQLVTISQPEAPGACVFSVSPRQFSVSKAAQTVAFDVTIATGTPGVCQWSVASGGSGAFVHTQSMTPSGNTTRVVLSVDENTGRLDRMGSVVAAGQLVTVHQLGSLPQGPCTYSVSTSTINAPAAASTATVIVTLIQGSLFSCGWSIVPNVPFITIPSAVPSPDGDGGTVVLSIAANPGVARTGTVVIAGNTVTVNQAAAGSVLPVHR
jgi:hypothetical protein